MEYKRIDDLKVTCIASSEDFEFFGISFDDLLDRTPSGFRFLKKVKELAAINQRITWTNVAYTLQISMLPDGRVSLTFSEMIKDYAESLKNSLSMADERTKGPLKEFIRTIQEMDDDTARKLVARFEKNVRDI